MAHYWRVTANPWLVSITKLRRAHGQRQHETRRGRLGEFRVGDSRLDASAEVTVDAELDSVDGAIVVSGRVSAPWRGECRRCLRPIEAVMDVAVREIYRARPARESVADEDTYPLSGEQLDLEPLARDAILLELPVNPLCHEGCGGLCPTCGAVLDEGPCACPPAGPDPRWAALDGVGRPAPVPNE